MRACIFRHLGGNVAFYQIVAKMKSSVKAMLVGLKRTAVRRPGSVVTQAMGRRRVFHAYDFGDDTMVLEKGVLSGMDAHASVLLAEKSDLRHCARGHLLTVTQGNHSVAALPLLGGKFWDLANVPAAKRSDTLTRAILCANVVAGKLEISQRDVSVAKLVKLDGWLTGTLGCSLADVVMADRNPLTIEHYCKCGQEWRVKPLAWTDAEMRVALAASRKKISTDVTYYHNARGVHLFSYPEFHRFASLAESDWEKFRASLREMVSVFEGNQVSFMRFPKYHGHHEIELFGVKRGEAIVHIVPELEKLMEGIALGRTDQHAAAARMGEIDALFKSMLSRPEFADESSKQFTSTLYMYLTGEIYSVLGEGATPQFDDRRTALPGATFVNGRATMHPGADSRSEVLLSNIRALTSKDEIVEYANIFELRNDDGETCPIGKGKTREIEYKMNLRPLTTSLIEKRMSHAGKGYGSYLIARVEAFKSIGVNLSDYHLLRRRFRKDERTEDYFIRGRCDGDPLAYIPANYFRQMGEYASESDEDREVVLQLAFLMGDAAAQNMTMLKYDPVAKSPLYGVGKEIYRFDFDIKLGRIMPASVACCSVRGSFGWPDLSRTDENLETMVGFYFGAFANTLAEYAAAHPSVPRAELADSFFAGFDHLTNALAWKLTMMRDEFESFAPNVPRRYKFAEKWGFAIWALERRARRMALMRRRFDEMVAAAWQGAGDA